MAILPVILPEMERTATNQCDSSFGYLMTQFARVNLKVALVGTAFGTGLFFVIKYFEKMIDDYDNRPDSFTQKTYTYLATFSQMLISAGIYIGVQGFLLSQILNIGYYLAYRKSAIHYSQIYTLSLL